MNLREAFLASKLFGNGEGSGLPDASGQADNTALSVQSGEWAASGAVLSPISSAVSAIVPSQTFSFSAMNDGVYATATDFVAIDGNSYAITWDGTDYNCTAIASEGQYVVGNLSITGMGANTGEPFIITNVMGTGLIATKSSSASHVVAISGLVQSPPDGSIMIVAGGKWSDQAESATPTKILPKYVPSLAIVVAVEIETSVTIAPKTIGAINVIFPASLPEGEYISIEIDANVPALAKAIYSEGTVSTQSVYCYNPSETSRSYTAGDYLYLRLYPIGTPTTYQ